ncbi:EI24 domain-containing protein [Catellatospora sp. KI3]|uniref:EI24 domain-containing protein n=1 Tax=Catellatospora sp. KI3 TaxID=3041620 RepID=UPI002482196B|nr:EI24 domain-containing protein [Catellatospora sp. KI3]MDI1460093.1 EI24 domain-containing protein [Catellatospora sp. KI3]
MAGQTLSNFFTGIRLYGRGLARYARSPRLVLLGLIPAFLSLLLFTGLFALLFYFMGDITDSVTWFARDWAEGARDTVRLFAGVAVVGASGLLAVLSYTAVTLLIGDPFYEKIAESIEESLGGVPNAVDLPWYLELRRSIFDALRLLLVSVLIAIPLFAGGFIPVVGQTVVPVLGAFVGGWFLALELVGVAYNRRGLRLPDRRRALRQDRAAALGFGVAVFCTFLIPLGAVLLMPAAVAGGTLLARRSFNLPTQ